MKSLESGHVKVLSSQQGDCAHLVFQLPKRLNFDHILAIEENGDRLIQHGCHVKVDLADLESLDSAGIGCLLHTKEKVDRHGGRFELTNISSALMEENHSCLQHHFQVGE